ncbi:MAG: 4-alpha-glucanotransferase, partial [Rubricella sp.]
MSDPVAALAGAVGILPAYTDQLRRVRETGPDTARALLGAMGLPVRNEADARAHLDRLADGARTMPRWHVSEPDRAPGLALSGSWEITFEDGTEQGGSGPLPALPLGRHRLESDGETCWMLVAPARLPSPPRRWGVTLPLYGLRTPERGGIGDYIDLAHWAEACAGAGAGFIGINPVHAGFPADPAAFSPYSPSHRRRLNTLHIACGVETASTGPLIDYPPEIATRRAALRAAYDR